MGRPPTALGTFGRISYERTSAGSYLARARYRDYDGKSRRVSAAGRTRAAAEAALKQKLRDRRTPVGSDLNDWSKLSDLADLWLTEKQESGSISVQTKGIYAHTLEKHVRPALGELRLREVTTGTVDRHLKALAKNSGTGTATSARAVLSGIFGLAVRLDAIEVNPVRSAGRISKPRRQNGAALTPESLERLRVALRSDAKAVELDLPDLIDFLASTGCRIGEAVALRASRLSLDDAPTARIDSTFVRQTGRPSAIQEFPKSRSGIRTIPLSGYIAGVLRDRLQSGQAKPYGDDALLFPSPLGRLRDSSNTAASIRAAFSRAGSEFDGVTSHSFRKYVLTQLDSQGFTARQVSDIAGHADVSMTQDVYLHRGGVHREMAAALELSAVPAALLTEAGAA